MELWGSKIAVPHYFDNWLIQQLVHYLQAVIQEHNLLPQYKQSVLIMNSVKPLVMMNLSAGDVLCTVACRCGDAEESECVV